MRKRSSASAWRPTRTGARSSSWAAGVPRHIADRAGCGLCRGDRVRVEEFFGGVRQLYELGDIDGDACRGERIARAPGLDVDGRTERTAEARHLDLHDVARSLRWLVTPQRLGQGVDADDLVEVVRQSDQDGPRPGSAAVDGLPVDRDCQRPEHVDARSGPRQPLHLRSMRTGRSTWDQPETVDVLVVRGISATGCGGDTVKWVTSCRMESASSGGSRTSTVAMSASMRH